MDEDHHVLVRGAVVGYHDDQDEACVLGDGRLL